MQKPGRDAREKQPVIGKAQTMDFVSVVCAFFVTRFKAFKTVNSALRRKGALIAVVSLLVPLSVLLSVLNTNIPVQAATSNQLNFQGRLLTSSGDLVPDGNYHVEFKLYNDTASAGTPDQGACTYGGGTPDTECLWTETRSTGNLVSIQNGYYSVYLGSVTSLPNIDWSQDLYLSMNIGGSGGGASWDGEMTPRFKLTAVPYAFRSSNVASSSTNAASSNSDNVSITTGNALGVTSNSGNITLDVGTATGTAGTISLGSANASALTLGRAGLTTTVAGSLTTAELLTANGGLTVQVGETFTFNGDMFTDLTGTGLTVTGNALTVDNTVLDNSFFIQNGNSFTANAVLGTNDAYSLIFETANTTALTIDTSQNITLAGTLAVNGDSITADGAILTINTAGTVAITDALTVTGTISDTDSNLILADTVDIGSATTGINVTTTGVISDIDGAVLISDSVNITTTGAGSVTITNATASSTNGALDLQVTSNNNFVPGLNVATTQTATGSLGGAYGVSNNLSSSAVVTGAGVGQSLYGSYNTVTKSGADTATGTYNVYTNYNLATNIGRTNAGTVNTYGGYFDSFGDTSGTSTVYGLYTTAAGGDINYGIYSAAGANYFADAVTLTSDLTVNGNTTIGNAVTDNLTVTSAIQGTNALIFDGSTDDTNEITLAVTNPGADFTITLPAETGTICTTGSVCTGYQAAVTGGAANQQLSNLSGTVAINTALLTSVDNTIDLGSTAASFRTLYADTSVLTPTLDVATAGALTIGNTTATSISVCNSAACDTLSLANNADADTITVGDSLDTIGINGVLTVNTNVNVATNINTGTNNALTTIGGGSGTFSLQTSNIDISSAGVISGATGLSSTGTIALSGAGTFSLDSSAFDVSTLGVISGATGLTSSGTITFSGLTPDRLVTTTTGGQLTNSISSANLLSSISDETGTGLSVFATSPTLSTSVVAGSASFDLLNTVATTVNAFGASTATTLGATTGNTTIRNALNLGVSSSVNGQILFRNSINANTITLQSNAPASSYTLDIPTLTANDTICVATLANCSAIGSAGGALTGTFPNPTLTGVSGAGAVTFQSATTGVLATDASNFYFDNSSERLAVGTATVGNNRLTVNNAATTDDILELQDNGTPVLTVADGGTVTTRSINPETNDTYDLGSTSLRWRDLYLGGETINIGASATDQGTLGYDSTSNILQFGTDSTTNGDISFFTDDLYLDKSTANVGIGTTGPATRLEVSGTGANIGITVDAPTGYYAMQYFAENGTNKWHYEVTPTGSGGSFGVVESGVSERLRIATGGNVSIGSTTTNNKFTVNGSAVFGGTATGNDTIEIQGSNAGISVYDRTNGATNRWSLYATGGASSSFALWNAVGGNRMTVDVSGNGAFAGDLTVSGGNLGIGVAANSSYILYAYYDSDTYASFSNDNNGDFYINGANADLYVRDSATSNFTRIHNNGVNGYIDTTGSTGDLILRPGSGYVSVAAGGPKIYNYSGNLAVNTAIYPAGVWNQSAVVTTAGQYMCWTDASGFGVARIYGQCTSSSLRYKRDIVSFPDAGLEQVRQLNPVTYYYNPDYAPFEQDLQVGFIAEEVAAINPLFATYNTDGSIEGVRYDKLTIMLANAVKQLDVQVQSNATRLAVVESGEFGGNLHVNGNVQFDGNLAVTGDTTLTKLTVTGDTEVQQLTINSKIITAGVTPLVTVGSSLTSVLGASVINDGTDTAGTVVISSGTQVSNSGQIAQITFNQPYSVEPKVIISGNNSKSAKLGAYAIRTETGFTIVTDEPLQQNESYSFDYFIIATQNP